MTAKLLVGKQVAPQFGPAPATGEPGDVVARLLGIRMHHFLKAKQVTYCLFAEVVHRLATSLKLGAQNHSGHAVEVKPSLITPLHLVSGTRAMNASQTSTWAGGSLDKQPSLAQHLGHDILYRTLLN